MGCGIIVPLGEERSSQEGDPDHPSARGPCGTGRGPSTSFLNRGLASTSRLPGPYATSGRKFPEWPRRNRPPDQGQPTRASPNPRKRPEVNRANGIASVAVRHGQRGMLHLPGILGPSVWFTSITRPGYDSAPRSLCRVFGRGAMTNHWIDIQFSDCFPGLGSNTVPNIPFLQVHPKAIERGDARQRRSPVTQTLRSHLYASLRWGRKSPSGD